MYYFTGIPYLPHAIVQALDASLEYHRGVALTICVSAVIHVAGHLSNITHIILACDSKDNITRHLATLMFHDVGLPRTQTSTSYNANGIQAAQSIAFITGVLLCLILAAIALSSRENVRRTRFNLFWYLHNVLFASFFVCLCVHAAQGFLKYQTNVNNHDPKRCLSVLMHGQNDTTSPCHAAPRFAGIGPEAWKWACVPLAIYLMERGLRIWRYFHRCTVTKLIKHSSHVLEIQMQKKGFKYGLGEWVFLHCQNVSTLEWHPFSLTSHPQEDFFSVHIRIVGDWTKKLGQLCEDAGYDAESCKLRMVVDGPYKSPASNVNYYQTIVCIGANIGVTPFVSVLKSFLYRKSDKNKEKRLKKVYFYWICPSMESFEWFKDLIQSVDQDMNECGLGDSIEYNLHLTRGWTTLDIQDIVRKLNDQKDSITGLNRKTNFGRPMWRKLFEKVAKNHQGSKIGVFYCGPTKVADDLNELCRQFSAEGATFVFHQEYFS